MKIVLDTNVLISGLLKPDGTPGLIVRLIASGYIELYYDFRIFNEYESVMLRPKFGFDKDSVYDFLEQIKSQGHIVTSNPVDIELPDPDDIKFLEAALSSGCDYLVTGNLKHFPKVKYKNIKIISPADFIELLKS